MAASSSTSSVSLSVLMCPLVTATGNEEEPSILEIWIFACIYSHISNEKTETKLHL